MRSAATSPSKARAVGLGKLLPCGRSAVPLARSATIVGLDLSAPIIDGDSRQEPLVRPGSAPDLDGAVCRSLGQDINCL
jgi:hypothetical protein